MNLPFTTCAKDDDGHSLTKLWSDYDKAVRDDRPKDQADILERIKKEAAAKHLAWDYYDACWRYVDARTSTNWKLRDELTQQANDDIERFGEPVAVFYNRKTRGGGGDLFAYVQEHREQLLAAHNPAFYDHDGSVGRFDFGSFLIPRIANDYEYALWSLYGSNRRGAPAETIAAYYQGRYPYEDLITYSDILERYSSETDSRLETFAQARQGKAVALLARDYLLGSRDRQLNRDRGQSEEYRALAKDCEQLIADRKLFSGDEKDLAECTDRADGILARLIAQEASVSVERGHAQIIVRNLPEMRVRVLQKSRELFSQTVPNPRKSFYLRDTLTLDLPDLNDGDYTLKCNAGKVETESEYRKYTLSIAHKRDLDGYAVYVADYLSGEPVQQCDITLYDDEDKVLDRVSGLVIDGFTYLPASFGEQLDKRRWGCSLQAVATIGGKTRMSQRHRLYRQDPEPLDSSNPKIAQAMILTDRGAFNPDETVHYKVFLYEGTYEYATRPAGIRLTAKLFDPTDKEIATEQLTTGEFGTAAGAFVLAKGERGGMYTIRIYEGSRQIASKQVRADEFVLPTFELSWAPDDRFYLPADDALVAGNVRSYSGHSLATATATYEVVDYGKTIAEGKLALSPAGDFQIRFRMPDVKAFYRAVSVTVRVTDATGETLEFSRSVNLSDRLPLNLRLENSVRGQFTTFDRSGGAIVGEDTARVRFQLGGGATPQTHPNLRISYQVLHGEQVILSGTAANGETVALNLSGRPSGRYTVRAEAETHSDKGVAYNDNEQLEIVKVADSDRTLDFDAWCFFKELPDDGTGIALQVGTTGGPAWVVTELYGDGNRLLEKRMVRLAGVRGQHGSLQILRFERKADYPETLTLKVFWFRNERSYEYAVSSYKPKEVFTLPLRFTRFLDTTAPHHDYSFTIQTAAGTELAATIFDKSTETIRPNVWTTVRPGVRSLPEVYYNTTIGADESYGFDTARGNPRLLKSNAAMGAARVAEDAPMMLDAMVEEEAYEASANETAEPEAAEADIPVRENFANTIAWEPFLRADQNGVVTFRFSTADKLSTYYVQLFAHDKAFHNAALRQEMVVTLPVKVAVVQPQFLYEGDRYVARVTVANSKNVPIAGRISVKFLNGQDYKTAPVVSDQGKRVTVPANGSFDYSCEIAAPKLRDLGMLVTFTADNADFGSDAVFVAMPVLPAVQTITEAHSALLHAGMDRDAVLAELRNLFVNVPGADAALREISILGMIQEAIPEKVLPQSDNLLDQSEALYANFLLDKLPGARGSAATPEQRAEMIAKILACCGGDGGFAWFEEMSSSPILTAVLLERLADMGSDCPPELAAAIPEAVKYLDKDFLGDRSRPFWCGGLSLDQYLHVRALFPEVAFSPKGASLKTLRTFRKEVRAYLVPRGARGLNGQVYAKARRMKTLRALLEYEHGTSLAHAWGISLLAKGRMSKSLDKDIVSLLQYAEPHRSGGIYYPNAVMPWRGLLESELYAHALLCNLLTDCGHSDVAEGIRLWLMVQKETQHWEDDPAYIQAIGCVLRGTEETLQTKVLALSASTTLPFAQIQAAGNGFTLNLRYLRDGKPLQDGDVLHVGDKIEAVYEIWNEENRSFVRLTAPRPAAFRPVQQLSGRYGWSGRPISITGWVAFSPQGYRNVLADRTEFWFDSYPEEKTSLTEEFFVTQEGSFQSPVPVIESLYAPHYRANSDGRPAVTVAP